MSNKGAKEMEATTIAHLAGQMDVILEMTEFYIEQIKGNDYLVELLMKQINQAKDVNEKIFEMHKKNELDKIKKTYNDESDENK